MISHTQRDKWTVYAAVAVEPKGDATKRIYVERARRRDEIRVSIVGADATMQQAVYLTAGEARDLRDMLSQALGTASVQASGDAHALRMIAEALGVSEAERHDGGIMRAIERLQADRDRLADIVEHKYGTDECDGCADRDLRIEELEGQLAEDLRLAMTKDGGLVVVEDAGDA